VEAYGPMVLLGIVAGVVGRITMLEIDYRQYPSYPHGFVIHLSLGIIASFLGAIVVPALLEKEYTAVTFLVLAAQQFREIRNMERETLAKLDQTELVPRGPDFVEGIARVFEARNYLVIFASVASSGGYYWGGIWVGILCGVLAIGLGNVAMQGRTVGSLARVRIGKLHFVGPLLHVDNIIIMNVGLIEAQKKILERGIGVIIEPLDDNARATLANTGQRQAIAHEVSALLGIHKDVAEPEFTPLLRLDLDTGRVGFFIVPIERDAELVLEAVRRVPVLESAIRRPLATRIGRRAAD
jgi:hypothetical protein